MSKQHDPTPGGDQEIEELLRQVGARDEPSSELTDEVQKAVHAEWRLMLAERSRRRRTFAYGIAASIAFAVVIATATIQWLAAEQDPVATIARIDGSLQLTAPGAEAPGDARVGQHVSVGETLRTDKQTRIALALSDGLSLRIDAGSTIEFAAPDRLVLHTGAVYVDSGPDRPRDGSLEVETRAGVVRHLGTQYQVRQNAHTVVIIIREGRIEVAGTQGENHATAGEVLRIGADGGIERAFIAAYDSSWQWAVEVAPTFNIDNQPLSGFLDWVARETGKTIEYASVEAQQTANAVVLRGSIAGLAPERALNAVLSTTELRRYETNAASIGIALEAPTSSK